MAIVVRTILQRAKTLCNRGMAFPAYHMNKQHWYTLLLDDTQSDNQVMELIRKSYALVE